MALLVLFVSYVLQVRFNPYLSHAVAAQTSKQHAELALSGDRTHVTIDATMRARAAFYRSTSVAKSKINGLNGRGAGLSSSALSSSASGTATGGRASDRELDIFYETHRSTFEKKVLAGRSVILSNWVANFLFDYNTTEAMLLGSAILVNLSGITFDSSRFTADQLVRPGIRAEYDSLAFAILFVMFFTIIYWFVALGLDIALVVAPDSVAGLFRRANACGSGVVERGRKLTNAKSLSSSKLTPGDRDHHRTSSGNSDPNAIHMSSNPLSMPTTVTKGGSIGSNGAASFADADILSMDAPPNPAQWRVIREAYLATSGKVKSMSIEIERLQSAALDTATGMSRVSTTSKSAKKVAASFSPMQVGKDTSVNPLLSRANSGVALRHSRSRSTTHAPPPADIPTVPSAVSLRSSASTDSVGELDPSTHDK